MGGRLAWLIVACAIGCGSPSRAPSDASEGPVVDAPAVKSEFDGACSRHTDCASGFCVEPVGATGGVCTRTCTDDCPTGWECRNVELPQVDLDLCIPAAPQLCLACANDSECGGGACLDIDGAGRCGIPCTDECPMGYTCAPDAGGTHTGSFCQPVTGSCSCSVELSGASRSCSSTNGIGTCFGSQTCNAGTGWSACTATVPAAETCDGSDNNCNFIIDDGVGGGTACMKTVAGIGSCPGVQACDGSSGFVCLAQTPTAEKCNFADDDCDAKTDEGFPGLGNACTAGVGACTRYGSRRCNPTLNALECSAVAAQPGTEACNGIDDDCDTMIDEPFKTGAMAIGAQCASGLGVCTRYGSYVCRGDGTGTQCSAAPGTNVSTESCNYLDDNCDGAVDNGFRNPTTGYYDTDTNCGACGTNCTTTYTAQNSFGACAVTTSAVCVMRCNAGAGNLNGSTLDGCEFVIDATAIYVSTTDAGALDDGTCGVGPTGTGAGNHPCKTITQGILRAVMMSRANVLVADGTYNEGVSLANGKNVLGGYRADTWERHLSTTSTVIAGATVVGSHDRTVTASSITAATIFEGFVVRGSFNTKAGGNSYAIYIAGSNASLVIRNNQVVAGRGGAGAIGAAGVNGTQGANGGGRSNTAIIDTTYDARSVVGCESTDAIPFPPLTTARQYANGGTTTCGLFTTNGGSGGGNRCPPSVGNRATPPQPTEKSAVDGTNGLSGGGPAGGAGQDAGDDGFLESNGNLCTIPAAPTFGVDGLPGGTGLNAAPVAGCSLVGGSVAAGHWTSGTASTGTYGDNGGGGGGGGAGGGAFCYDCDNTPDPNGWGNHRVGGHGGGGGGGGCAGGPGGAGQGGGGVFGIFISGGSPPTITSNAIARGTAGNGGSGGIAGAGGFGGQGGTGGRTSLHCTDKGGRGGDGGNGGHGPGGGGGCGGSSFGIYTNGIGTPPYCTTNTVTGGAAGAAGAGGFSGGSTGGTGASGALQACTST